MTQRQDRRRRLGDRYRQCPGPPATPAAPARSSTFVPSGQVRDGLPRSGPTGQETPRLWWRGSWSPPPARRPGAESARQSHRGPRRCRTPPADARAACSSDAPQPAGRLLPGTHPSTATPQRVSQGRDPADRLLPRGSVDPRHHRPARKLTLLRERGRQLDLPTPRIPCTRAHGHRPRPDNAARNVAISCRSRTGRQPGTHPHPDHPTHFRPRSSAAGPGARTLGWIVTGAVFTTMTMPTGLRDHHMSVA